MERLRAFFDIQREARADAAALAYTQAKIAVKAEIEPVAKTHRNDQTRSLYAKLEDVEAALDPLLVKHGFTTALSERPTENSEEIRFIFEVRHIGGHVKEYDMNATVDYKGIKGNPAKTKFHGMLSSYTGAKRALKCHVFDVNLVDDDDGNRAGGLGHSMEKISPEQVKQLNALADEVEADKIKLCKYLKVGSVIEIPASRYQEVMEMLEQKRRAKSPKKETTDD